MPMTGEKNVEWFVARLAKAQWVLNYPQFCERAGFREDDYSEGKWREFQALAHSAAQFDPGTLQRIIAPEQVNAA